MRRFRMTIGLVRGTFRYHIDDTGPTRSGTESRLEPEYVDACADLAG